MATRKEIFDHLNALIQKDIKHIQKDIKSLEESKANDTKSSAGDKFETSREMAQQEVDKLNQQLAIKSKMTYDLKSILESEKSTICQQGSIVKTSLGTFILGIAYGNMSYKDENFFAISLASPIGQLLLNKSSGEQIQFNGRKIEILELI